MVKILTAYLKTLVILIFIILLGFGYQSAFASSEIPLEITLTLNDSLLEINESGIARLTIVNNSPFEVFNISIDYQYN
ncbi:MAG TPA: hypothetical protein VJ987_09880, partial [Anaerolineales bacterium]|nr:hypothetical protein [Anaerolineales bacterium]